MPEIDVFNTKINRRRLEVRLHPKLAEALNDLSKISHISKNSLVVKALLQMISHEFYCVSENSGGLKFMPEDMQKKVDEWIEFFGGV